MLERLDPVTRTRVLSALLGLVILAVSLMLLAWMGARVARRYRKRTLRKTSSSDTQRRAEDTWWKKPLTGDPESVDRPNNGS
jgi:hypothetical protein